MTIAEVCKQCNVTPDTLRYYERIGLIPPVRRTGGGIRDYGERDVNWITFIRHMRSAGLQVNALVRYVALFRKGDASLAERKEILVRQRDLLAKRLAAQQAVLEKLDAKIANYEERCVVWERTHLRGERKTERAGAEHQPFHGHGEQNARQARDK